MIITKIELVNFGGHASISFSPGNDPVVGVTGRNGAGKSTLLAALKYAFTGQLELKAEAYMRDGGVHGSTSVVLHFRKGDITGSITRKITKTTASRSLEMTGLEKPATSAKDVDRLLSGLLGADRRAAVEAVFVPQGSLQNLLFAEPTDREVMMQRMIGCAHFQTVSTNAEKMAQQYRSTITDVTAQLAEAKVSLEGLTARHDETVARLPVDMSQRLNMLQTALQDYNGNLAAQSRYSAGMGVLRGLVTAEGNKQPEHLNYEDWLVLAQNKCGSMTQAIEDAQHKLRVQKASLAEIQQSISRMVQLQDKTNRLPGLHRAVAEFPDCSAVLEDARAQYAAKKQEIAIAQDQVMRRAKLQQLRADRDALEAEVTELAGQLRSHEAYVHQVEASVQATSTARQNYEAGMSACKSAEVTIKMLDQLLGSQPTQLACCPLCLSQSSSFDIPALRARREEAAQLVQKMQREYNALVQAEHTAISTANSASAALTNARMQHTGKQAALAATPVPPEAGPELDPAIEVAVLTTALAGIEQTGRQLNEKQAAHHKAKAELQAAIDDINRMDPSWLTAPVENQVAQLNDLQLRQTACLNEGSQLAGIIEQNITWRASWSSTAGSVTTALHGVVAAWADRKEIPKGFDPVAVEEEIGQLREHQTKLREAQAALQEIARSIQVQAANVTRYESIQEQNSKVLRCCADLDTIAGVFGRTGAARDYMHDVFSDVLVVTQHNLSRMGADFTVRPAEGPMAFEFIRNSSESGAWLLQKQMSGGQRVRMGVAFLLSLQQIVIPEVGMLVLDEPTTHLDQEGREGLRDLLLGLRDHLQSGTTQFWVCDHSQELKQAFSSKLELTGA